MLLWNVVVYYTYIYTLLIILAISSSSHFDIFVLYNYIIPTFDATRTRLYLVGTFF